MINGFDDAIIGEDDDGFPVYSIERMITKVRGISAFVPDSMIRQYIMSIIASVGHGVVFKYDTSLIDVSSSTYAVEETGEGENTVDVIVQGDTVIDGEMTYKIVHRVLLEDVIDISDNPA